MSRIAVDAVIPSFAAGGAERVMLSFLTGLNADRFDIRLLALDPTGPLEDLARSIPAHVDFGGKRMRQALPALVKAVRARRPSILFSSQAHINLALLACKPFFSGTKIVVREANMPSLCLKNGHWPAWYGWVYGRLLCRAGTVIATSRAMAGELRDDFGVDADRIEVLPNPVDTEMLRTASETPLRHPGPGRRFVAVGRLVHQKGFDRLIGWMSDSDADDHLTLIGDGPLNDDLQQASRAAGLENRILFAGFQSTPWPMVAGADALLMPSRWEGLPNAALEALAVGTPVIATAESGGIQDIADLAGGAVTVADDDRAFIDAMRKTAIDPVTGLRPGLLPDPYDRAHATGRFSEMLTDLA